MRKRIIGIHPLARSATKIGFIWATVFIFALLIRFNVFAYYISLLVSIGNLALIILFALGYLTWFLASRHFQAPPTNVVSNWIGFLGAVISFNAGQQATYHWTIQNTKNFVAENLPKLDEIKRTSKRYPLQLPVEMRQRMPELLKFESDGETVSFEYNDPMLVGDSLHLNSKSRLWEHWSTWESNRGVEPIN